MQQLEKACTQHEGSAAKNKNLSVVASVQTCVLLLFPKQLKQNKGHSLIPESCLERARRGVMRKVTMATTAVNVVPASCAPETPLSIPDRVFPQRSENTGRWKE